MKKLLSFSFSKIYIIAMILISLLVVGGYFSYAMFTVSKERSNAISIVTGNLIYDLTVDGEDIESLVIPANTTMEFIVVLSNPNNRIARFNFYYLGNLPDGVSAGYIVEEYFNIPPEEVGINLERNGTSGSSNTYKIKITNANNNSVTINLGVSVGLDYNDLTLPSNGHLFEEYISNLSNIVLTNQGENGDVYNDGEDTFITGEDPNNYVWYSGKLWRAVSVNNEAKTTKLVTQWNISTINYSNGNSTFSGSYMEEWLNDTTVDGFLGNLRNPDKFIVTDAKWDATMDDTALGSITRPNGITTATSAVGLLNIYEYQESFRGVTYSNGYLNNGLVWWTLTPYNSSYIRNIDFDGKTSNVLPDDYSYGIRPTINLKPEVKIVSGNGTEEKPYRLEGDNDTNISGTLLSSRYSGEYINFGTGENNLYRIVSHETKGLTKITSAEPLKDKYITFGDAVTYSSTNTIGSFLNGDYLTSYVDSSYSSMIEDSTTWYLGTVSNGTSYKLAKYTDANMSKYATSTEAKVGLLRYGELMAGQFNRYAVKGGVDSANLTTDYWLITPYNSLYIRDIYNAGGSSGLGFSNERSSIKPALNLKSNVVITGGDGTKNNPFTIALE